MPRLRLQYDLRLRGDDADARHALYCAALDQIAWADRLGFDRVMLHEHHGSDDGYLPSPMVFAAAVAARTERLTIEISALIASFHDPLRVAEDLAVVDVVSGGRLELTVAAGYNEAEFEMFGVPMAGRGRAVERVVSVLRQAWTGQPFDHDGRTVQVRPRPHRRPSPPIYLGGSSEAAARRAARIGDGYRPSVPETWTSYRDELAILGRDDPGPLPRSGPWFLHISDDPEGTWPALGSALLHESRAYAGFHTRSALHDFVSTEELRELRALGRHRVVTPEECVHLARDLGPEDTLTFRPLAGGLDPALAERSLRLFEEKVLPSIDVTAPS